MVLSFDPGVTCGIACLDDQGEILFTKAVPAEDVDRKYLADLCYYLVNLSVVIEKGPGWAGHYRFLTQEVEEALKFMFPNATWVSPGQWKDHPAARFRSKLKHLTQHEKDAVGIASWFQATKEKSAGNTA